MEARFIGDPANGFDGPRTITLFETTFTKGRWVGVDEKHRTKLDGNCHFQVREDGVPDVPETPEIEDVLIAEAADAEADIMFNGAAPAAFDHDGDGKPGGSLSRAELVARLTELGVDFDSRWGVPKLRDALESAEFDAGEG